jgi:VacB/RNase II family 3'-5' exoribonuclease
MKIELAAQRALSAGFSSIMEQFKLPRSFPAEVEQAADQAVSAKQFTGRLSWQSNRRDATDLALVTLDPSSSTDLDQAFAITSDGDAIVLHYALADVGAFVAEGGTIEREAWERGVTIYGMAEKISLYPKVISQGAASLLPDGPRPAVLVVVAIKPNGRVALRKIERVVCMSRAKLAYDNVDLSKIPYLEEFAKRMWDDEVARGAIRVDFPQQEVIVDENSPGGVRLVLRARLKSELVNSTLSLAVNTAVGSLFRESHTGLFRVMDEPDPRAIAMLRRVAHALHIPWSSKETLRDLQRRLDSTNIVHQRFLLDARRSGGRASYAVYDEKKVPWHSAIGATYSHATAPMRRLADRYVLDLACLLANGESVPQSLIDKIAQLPKVMERCESRASNVDRAVIDLIEAVSLQHRVGETMEAEVVDAENSLVQTIDSAIRARASKLPKLNNGSKVFVRIDFADPEKRRVGLTYCP